MVIVSTKVVAITVAPQHERADRAPSACASDMWVVAVKGQGEAGSSLAGGDPASSFTGGSWETSVSGDARSVWYARVGYRRALVSAGEWKRF
jgi:hypothetical protein